jgi:DNA-binding MarR family transcriptional regulator
MAARRAIAPGPEVRESAAFEETFMDFLRALRRARGRAARDPSFDGLSLAQYQLLEAVDTVGQEGNARVAEAAGVAEPTVTRALTGLERRGLISRARGGEDRRSVRIELTDQGLRELGEKRALVRRRLREIHRSLDAAEREQAVALMRRLAELIETL